MRLLAFIFGLVAFTASAAAFDCQGVTMPSSLVICSDPELMRLADERQQAINAVRWKQTGENRLSPEDDKRLLADQNAWVRSYATACGVPPEQPAPMPVPLAVRECFAKAARARLDVLRKYQASFDLTSAPSPQPIVVTPAASGRIGPSFDCTAVRQPMALMLCSDPQLSVTDLRFGQAYFALLQSLDRQGQLLLKEEDQEFILEVQEECNVPQSGSLTPQVWQRRDCVKSQYERQTTLWVERTTGAAHQEAMRSPQRHIALQKSLQQLGFLTNIPVSGVYAGGTRAAIAAWQTARGRASTGLLGDDDARALDAEAGSTLPPDSDHRTAALTPTPLYSTEVAPAAPIPDLPRTEVPLKEEGGTYGVPVRINDALTLTFMVDSGAADVLLPADVVLTLIRTETLSSSDFVGEKTYRLADGSKLPSMVFMLRELRVGSHTLRNVRASVGPPDGGLLLGQSFLSRFKTWTFDNERHVLVLVER